MSLKPLAGILIVDLTVAVAGPVAAQILGDLGAEVIRVEAPFARPTHHHDVSPRLEGTPDRPYNRVVSYNDLHRSKRGLTLDLQKEAGREALLRLVARSDAVIENMAPRVLPSLRLDYDDLRAARADIVLVSMPAFGLSGPMRDRVSYGPGIDAISGLAHLTGYADRGPMNASLYFCDYNAGALAALATIAALRERDRTGQGRHVELAMLEGELQLLADALFDARVNGRIPLRRGNQHPSMSPHGAYPCRGKDSWIAIACEDDAQWQALCRLIGRPDLSRDPRLADAISRVRNRDEVDEVVSSWTRRHGAREAADALQTVGVPASPVQSIADLFDDPQLAHRDYLQSSHHPEAGDVPHTRVAFTLARTPARIDRAAPVFAQDNDYALRELLGMSAVEVEALEAAHVIRREPPPAKAD